MSTPRLLSLDKLTVDHGIQPRGAMSERLVQEFAEALQGGAVFPAVLAVDDGEKTWIYDGFHRLEAHRKAGKAKIQVEVRKGTRRDAIRLAAGANSTHGQRRSDQDKRTAVGLILADRAWAKNADRWIARVCRVSPTLVGTVRSQREECRQLQQQMAEHQKARASEPQTRTVQRGGQVYGMRIKPRPAAYQEVDRAMQELQARDRQLNEPAAKKDRLRAETERLKAAIGTETLDFQAHEVKGLLETLDRLWGRLTTEQVSNLIKRAQSELEFRKAQ
jgi:hypothetical protein